MAGPAKRRRSFDGRARKRMRSTPMLRMSRTPTSTFRRHSFVESWVFSTGATTNYWRNYNPQMASISNFAEYAALFDKYQCHSIKVTFCPNKCSVDPSDVTTGSVAPHVQQWYLTTGIQKGEPVVPTGTYGAGTYNVMTSVLDEVKVRKFDRPLTVTFKPNILIATNVANEIKACPWLPTSNSTQSMLGCAAFLHDANFAGLFGGVSALVVDVHFDFIFSCKGTR